MPNVALGLGDGPRAQFAHACMCIFNTFYITSTGTKSFSRAPVALFHQPSRWREADLELAAAVLAHTRGWLRCDSPRRARLIRACAGQPFVRTGSAVGVHKKINTFGLIVVGKGGAGKAACSRHESRSMKRGARGLLVGRPLHSTSLRGVLEASYD